MANGKAIAVAEQPKKVRLVIPAPNFQRVQFEIVGLPDSPLVIHRFSAKKRLEMLAKMEAGSTANKGKKREPLDKQKTYDEARYISPDGWDGFHASALRSACISACRLVGFKMTIAKMSIFIIADGHDKDEKEIPLTRIIGTPRLLDSIAHTSTGEPYVTIRPCYDTWTAKPVIEFDADQFTLQDVTNLLNRAGRQVGIGEGRPDSKNSPGLGWGTFQITGTPLAIS
jgi:hypothetical protein